jgi:hypothetical protein
VFIAALTEPIDVQVSSGTDWITPVSILLAGLLAAWLSWITHRRTLRHERMLREREVTVKPSRVLLTRSTAPLMPSGRPARLPEILSGPCPSGLGHDTSGLGNSTIAYEGVFRSSRSRTSD